MPLNPSRHINSVDIDNEIWHLFTRYKITSFVNGNAIILWNYCHNVEIGIL